MRTKQNVRGHLLVVAMLMALMGCEPAPGMGSGKDPAPGADTGQAGGGGETDTDTEAPVVPDLSLDMRPAFASPPGDALYDLRYLPSLGRFAVSSPFYDDFTGAIWTVDGDTMDLELDAPETWLGSAGQAEDGSYPGALGCRFGFTYDGTGRGLLTSYEFAPDYVGRLLIWEPTAGDDVVAAHVAEVNVYGEVAGTDQTGGFFGGALLRFQDHVLVSQTNAAPHVLVTSTDLLDVPDALVEWTGSLEMGADSVAGGGDGYAAVDMAEGPAGDGFAVASYGGVVAHFGPDLEPDWWWSLDDGTQDGAASLSDRTVSEWTWLGAWPSGVYAVSVKVRGGSELMLLDATTGARVERAADSFGYAEGVTEDGLAWRAYGVFAYYDEEETQGGYLRVEREDGQQVEEPLPMEGDYLCLPRLASDGGALIAWICLDGEAGGLVTVR